MHMRSKGSPLLLHVHVHAHARTAFSLNQHDPIGFTESTWIVDLRFTSLQSTAGWAAYPSRSWV